MTRPESVSDRRLATLAALVALSLFVVAMVVVRVGYTGSAHYGGLIWNLFLAWIPFALALAVYDGYRRNVRAPVLVAAVSLWLVFFPNAPYLVTDLKHLRGWHGAPLWFDVVLVSSAAWTGLLLGLISLYLVHLVARRVIGSLNAWLVVAGILAVSSFGIYLGRFRRWNSWDLFVRPESVLGDVFARISDPLAYPRALAVTLLFTTFLAASYLVFYALVRASAALPEDSRPG